MELLIILKQISLSLLLWCIIIPLLFLSSIYRAIINVILKIKFKEKYGGLVTKRDCIFHSSSMIDTVYISGALYVKSDHKIDLLKEIRRIIKEKVFDNPEHYPKLTSSKHIFGGYAYYIKNNVNISEVLKTYDIPCDVSLTEDYLKEVLGEFSNLGRPNDALWELRVVPRPLDDGNPNGFYRYVMIVRVHHSIGDGVSFMTLLVQLFGDVSTQNFSNNLYDKLFKDRYVPKTPKIIHISNAVKLWKNFLTVLEMCFISPARIIEVNFPTPRYKNWFKVSKFSGEKFAAWTNEHKAEFFPMVKSIKNTTDTKVSSILVTAVYESLLAHCKRTLLAEPKSLSAFMTIRTKPPITENLKPISLENYTSYAIINFPIELKSESALKNLKVLTQEKFSKIRSADVVFCVQTMQCLVGYIPLFLLNRFFQLDKDVIISIVPGGSQIKILDGCILENIVPLLPLFHSFSIAFAVVTYDGRLQVSVAADKKITGSTSELQKIANDVFHFIKIIDSESKGLYSDS